MTGTRKPGPISRARRRLALLLAPPVEAGAAGIPWAVQPGPRLFHHPDGSPRNPEEILAGHIPGADSGGPYPHGLPPELAAWCVYTPAGGHQIAVRPASTCTPAGDPAAFLVLVPVRTVLWTGWATCDGIITCDIPVGDGPAYSPIDLEY